MTPPGLTWQLVHAQPGSLVYEVAAGKSAQADRTPPSGWEPGGPENIAGLAPGDGPEEHPLLHYAGSLGRVGVLAAALGVGAALDGTQGLAWAEPQESEPSSSRSTGRESHSQRGQRRESPGRKGDSAAAVPTRRGPSRRPVDAEIPDVPAPDVTLSETPDIPATGPAVTVPDTPPVPASAPAPPPQATVPVTASVPLQSTAVPNYTLDDLDHTTGSVLGEFHVDGASPGALSYTVTGGPADGSVTLGTDGTFTYTPSADARHDASTEEPGPADLSDTFTVTVDDHQGGTVDIPVYVMIDPAVTRLTVSDPESEGTLHVSVGSRASGSAGASDYLAVHSEQARRDAGTTTRRPPADPGRGLPQRVVVGPTTVSTSALTESLLHSTGGLTGTVLGLDPAFFPVMGTWMNDFATINGRTFHRVWYPNIPSAKNAEAGVAALDKHLHETPGMKIIFGHSMGAQVAAKWLREKGPTSDIPASEVVFILCGNPERKYGGALSVPATPKLWQVWQVEPTYGDPGIPDDTPYTVIDYARQYDWWADGPTVATPSRAAQSNCSQAVHSDYFHVGIDDADVLTYVEGNRIYKLKPTHLAAADRAVVEQCYNRPTGSFDPGPITPPRPTGPPRRH
jgi:VCBS repeat-containing protein